MMRHWRGVNVIVTGGSGFIGTNLLAALGAAGAVVRNLDVVEPRDKTQARWWRQTDIRLKSELSGLLQADPPDYLFHLAARTDLDGRTAEDYSSNIGGTEALLGALAGIPPPRGVVFFSSMLVCEPGYRPSSDTDYRPNTHYGRSKVLMEELIRKEPLPYPWVLVRPSSIWGPWFGAPYRQFFEHVLEGRFAVPSGHSARKTLGYVENTSHQVLELAQRIGEIRGGTFYLGDTPAVAVLDWANEIRRQARLRPVRVLPRMWFEAGARIGDLLARAGWHFPLTRYRLANLTRDNVVDLGSLNKVCGTPPIGLAEGVARTIQWMGHAGR